MTRRAKWSVTTEFRALAHSLLDAYLDSHPGTTVLLIAGDGEGGVDAVSMPPALSLTHGLVRELICKVFPEMAK